MTDSVSFKAYLQSPGGETEARRFGVDKDVVTSYTYMKNKLCSIFPSLQDVNDFVLSWKDSDGDNIAICSDEELIIALTEMHTDIRKLYVTLIGSNQSNPKGGQHAFGAGVSGPVHTDVCCDACNSAVQGFRYKCVNCENFDLCAACESQGCHPEHFMIRMPVPVSLRPHHHFGRRLAHHLNRSARKAEGRNRESDGCDWQRKVRWRESCPGDKAGGGGLLDSLAQYFNSMAEETMQETAGPKPAGQHDQAEDPHVKYLRTVGQSVANFLNPIGIDVNFEIQPKKGKESEQASTSKPQPAQACTSKTQATKPNNEKQFADKERDARMHETSEADDWTVLNSAEASGRAGSSTNIATSALSPEQSTKIPIKKIYPTLPTEPTQPIPLASQDFINSTGSSASAVPNVATPLIYRSPPSFVLPTAPPTQPIPFPSLGINNQKVKETLDRMLAMGFTNDGGWLQNLVESKNGDIEKVLDQLLPMRKAPNNNY